MRPHIFLSAVLALSSVVMLSACRPSGTRTYTLQGQVLEVAPDREQAVVKHEEIKGLMPAMTMPYKVVDRTQLKDITPGDLINATLVIVSNDAYLSEVRKVGQAPLEKPAEKPSASSGFELLKPGEAIPDVELINQDGKKQRFSSFHGGPVALTFIYTSCPLPTFCPLMDRHFASNQRELDKDPALARVHLVSVSFDPITDTPAVLKKHANTLSADPARWTFFTGDRDEIDRFGARFGVTISRALDDPLNIAHNLRTVIIDADGKLVKVYTGNEWTPAQVLADLRSLS
jgi:protein SCO1/2